MNKKQKIRWIFCVAGMEFRKWISLKNFLILLLLQYFWGNMYIGDMISVAISLHIYKFNMLEPFDLVMSFQFYILVIPLVFCVLLSGFPDNSANNIFAFSRSNRVMWLCGQLLFGMLTGTLCILFFVVTSLLWVGRNGAFSNHWSSFMTDMYAGFPEIYAKNDRLFLESGTMSHGTPISVAMICIGLMLCYFMVLLQILCFFHLTGHKKMGMFVAMSVTVIGAISVSFF